MRGASGWLWLVMVAVKSCATTGRRRRGGAEKGLEKGGYYRRNNSNKWRATVWLSSFPRWWCLYFYELVAACNASTSKRQLLAGPHTVEMVILPVP